MHRLFAPEPLEKATKFRLAKSAHGTRAAVRPPQMLQHYRSIFQVYAAETSQLASIGSKLRMIIQLFQ